MRINTKLSNKYKEWVLRQSTIMSKFFKYFMKIKNDQAIYI